MPVKYHEFIDSAESMLDAGTEISFRNAISRAYYGLYHFAKTKADEKAWFDYVSSSHQGLIDRYKNNGQTQISYVLADLHKVRCKADYEMDRSFDNVNTEYNVDRCKKLIKKIEEI